MQAARTRLLTREGGTLGDDDLLGVLLAAAMPADAGAARLAAEAVARFGSFAGLLAAPLAELRGFEGFGVHALAAIKLVHEAALRVAKAQMQAETVLSNETVLIAYLNAVLAREKIEQFRILFLDAGDWLIADEAQARGTVNHTPVYPREVVWRALELQAVSLVLVHNHPSGGPTPSREDIAMTRQVRDAAAVQGIAVRDHVIVGNGRWTSFREAGLLD